MVAIDPLIISLVTTNVVFVVFIVVLFMIDKDIIKIFKKPLAN